MASFDIDGDLVRKLADLLRETGLSEIEFAEGEKRIRVTRPTAAQTVAVQAAPVLAAAPVAAAAAPAGKPVNHPGAVTSPMVGTAYLAAEPGGTPFVRPGDVVKAGQTIMIIEAMKVMNPIKAPRGGTVAEVLVSDAQPVEFGEVLLIIE
ncbi:acetyl-CoA carboxylase biotin carboxyl carrier protein [Azospirillum oryzae]|uniref:Biotin carboxyl carrier protein of acetyl-CoA carboxylase n=1 Tax=Azospirillum oryzae TaxID=286727 RepID=A0A6N1AL71_9PROT|nr:MULTISPECIES: acetyl-CoA carboxylase biotin carboxyl carrier protein subunit [Azospirillum]KAA0572736.1 acetyl-CoA carboxylase biotin carboxyl carrier protein [Azospirillum sp. Sh1]KAA0591157.1 acetyl-CoA carboxylase biotin carboxyl carrier protein [Azospirillum oryzae]PWC95716.1 acetyl-CoA carboxylase [Azospirillum sp. TSO5]QKS52446.1 acetyl-CoA carboxylase biotin carboxyl carrier protein [Azospirillum oryzae]GLR82856.1 acetyl-CoA carboxylase biotin carboxyl carrier protein subunit [Azospi